jgi:hypothetical protein
MTNYEGVVINMRESLSRSVLFLSLAALFIASGCSKPAETPVQPAAAPVRSPQSSAPPPATSTKGASILASPNPIQVCDGSGLGITTLTYKFVAPVKLVDVRVGSPSGPQLAHSSIEMSSTTGKWVNDGTIFYLQDVSDGKSLTPENTLATVTVGVTTDGCK